MSEIEIKMGNKLAITPTIISSIDDMERVAAEMKLFAKDNPYDCDAAKKAILDNKNLDTNITDTGLLHVRGYDKTLLGKYNRYILFSGWTMPFQLTYVINTFPEGTIQQLTILDTAHNPLESEMIRCMAAFFWEFEDKKVWLSVSQIPGTPPYAAVLVCNGD